MLLPVFPAKTSPRVSPFLKRGMQSTGASGFFAHLDIETERRNVMRRRNQLH